MPRPKQRTPELAEAVLTAGLRLIAAEGPAALTARRVAAEAGTSPAAVYELFGDKAGVVRALFFHGWERLAAAMDGEPADDPVDELRGLAARYRTFLVGHPALAAVMLARPFAAFDPAPEEARAGAAVRRRLVAAVQRAIDAGRLRGDPDDISLALLALVQGLAAAESARRLGSTSAVQRRWDTAVDAMLSGFA